MTTNVLTSLINTLPPRQEERRNYIGASSIGHPCLRKIWYQYKGYESEPITQKQEITFEIGKKLERLILDKLSYALNIHALQEELTEDNIYIKSTFLSKFLLHTESKELPEFQGNLDGMLESEYYSLTPNKELHKIIKTCGTWIVEIKTAKNSSFNTFKNKGLLEWSEQYHAQVQSYMGMSGIHKAYLLALNKDTSELWDEEIEFDAEYYAMLVERAKLIRDAVIEPPRVNGSPSFYICKQCQFRKICHDN